jgi:class 3 adenylate cyclase/tetratricopeptide (TPR) repeat protein/tRNA A-37 threonylcarbamoyl transferase component Bud32
MSHEALGKYELIERLATGGMAELYLARARGPAGVRKTVVVKRIRPELAEDPRFVNLFINEARIGVHLNHPNIVAVYELDRSHGVWFIAMEFVNGRDLTRVLRALGGLHERLPPAIAVFVAAEVARGLHHAHSRTTEEGASLALVHQDVSPQNILVSFDGEVKLVDFGIARFQDAEGGVVNDSATPAGRGKFAYASPESQSAGPVDHRSDLYSLGVVLWEMLVGARPYHDLPPATRLARIQTDGIPSVRDARPDLDDELAALVDRATRQDPSDRPASAALFEEDLRAWLYRRGERTTGADLSAVLARLFPDERRRRRGVRIRQFAADLARLDTTPAAPAPSGPLPGRLQQSPGERKQVAVVVVDVDGLTELSARLDPERFFRRQFRLLRWVRRIVDAWGGVLQRAIDDHLFILFGVPRTREDDLSRAMDCAIELQRRREELVGKGLSLEFCIGLHAGEVTVGVTRGRVQYMARGNTTRLARRLSASADHGEILVSHRVVAQMVADFKLSQGPAVPSRGSQPPLPSYRLDGRREGIRLARRGPWLRRGEEIEQLTRAVEGLQHGVGTALALLGPVGAGKTRLADEVLQLARRRRIPFHVVQTGGWGRGHPFRGLVLGVFGIDRGADADEVATQLGRAAELGLSEREIAVLRWLAGGALAVRPERDEWVHVLERLLHGLCAEGAAILSMELDGFAPDDLAVLAYLLRRAADRPLLALLISRPPLPGALQDVVEVVALHPFDRAAQVRLMQSYLGVDDLPPALVELVHATSEGNPLYLQEIVKFLLDRGDLEVGIDEAVLTSDRPLQLPASLHSLLAARIDALDAASKGILQLASILGMRFDAALLGRAAGLDDPSPLLLELEAAGLVTRMSDGWAFTTELVREAASRGTLGVQRRSYHRLVSEAIEAMAGDRLEPWTDELALHCSKGGRWVDAARHARQAGVQRERAGRLEEARAWFQRGLTWLASATDPDDHDARVQGEATLNLEAGRVSILLGDTDRGSRLLTLALDIASESGLPWIEVRAHLQLGRRHLAEGRHGLAAAHLGTAREMAHLDDPQTELEVIDALAALALEQGRSDEAEALWQEVLDRAEDEPVLSARCQSGLATRWLRAGQTERARPMLESALSAARAAKDRILEGRVLNNLGLVYSLREEHETALKYYRRALEVREGIGYTRGMVINHHNIGDVHFQRGDHARAHVAFQRSHELATAAAWTRGQVLNEVFLAYLDAHFERSSPDLLDEVRVRALEVGDATSAATARWLRGRLHLEANELDEASTTLHLALREAEGLGLAPVTALVQQTLASLDDPSA